MSLILMAAWFSCYLTAGVAALLFELGELPKGCVTDAGTIYVLQVVGVVLALALIPLSLRGFKKMVDRLDEKEYSDERICRIYMTCSLLRTAAFFIVIVFGTILYYLIDDTIGLYVAAIGAICSMFAFPTKGAIENETGF